MHRLRPFLWPALLASLAALFAWLATRAAADLHALPEHPVAVTVAELSRGGAPRWAMVTDGAPLCADVVRVNGRDIVPVVATGKASEETPAMVLVALGDREFCATMKLPLLLEPTSSALKQRTLAELRALTTRHDPLELFQTETDPIGDARINLGLLGCLLIASLGGLARSTRGLRRRRGAPLSSVGVSAAAPAGGEIVTHAPEGAQVLPPAPLVLSAQTLAMQWRQKYVGLPLQMLTALALLLAAAWSGLGIMNDLHAWHFGVPVPAEVKGTSHSKLVISVLDVDLIYQMPGEDHVRSQSRWLMTLWMPDDDIGAVRALADHPTVVTFEEAVDLVPLRLPLPVALLVLAAMTGAATRKRWRSPHASNIVAQTAVEALLHQPSFTAVRVNGVVTSYTLRGILDGVAVEKTLARDLGPERLIVGDATGALLVAKSADGSAWCPIAVDGQPFAWSQHDLTRAQAVLRERGSWTQLERG